MLLDYEKATVVLFGCHPDDIEIGCGGTAILMSQKGYTLHNAVISSGEEGGIHTSKNELIKTREAEATAASKFIGTKDITFFRFDDGLTHFDKDMKLKVIHYLKDINPDIVLVHCSNDQNPDHRVCTKLVLDALKACEGPWYPETKDIQLNTKLVLGYEVWTPIQSPHTYVDISNVLDKKLKAIRFHKSQLKEIHYDKAIEGLAYYRSLLNKKNAPCEAFEIFSIHD